MALNRIVASMEDSTIATIAEYAVERKGGSFDLALAELVLAGREAVGAQDRVQAAVDGVQA